MKVAIFVAWGTVADKQMIPEDCPAEYAKPENRHKLATWLEINANNKGPFIVEEWQDGVTTYEYLYRSDIGDRLKRIAVVDVDASRPWLIHNYDGWEEIWYLDGKGDRNQVIPEVLKANVGDYRFGEKEDRKFMLKLKTMRVDSVSVLLNGMGKAPEGYFATTSVREARHVLRRCSDYGMEVEVLDVYNELGENAGEGCELLVWLLEESSGKPGFRLPKNIIAHSSDGSVREKMERIIRKLYR